MFGEVGVEGDGALQNKGHSLPVCLCVLLQFILRIFKEPSVGPFPMARPPPLYPEPQGGMLRASRLSAEDQ